MRIRPAFLVTIAIFLTGIDAQAQSAVDSVKVTRHVYQYGYFLFPYHQCGSGIYATFPNVAAQVLDREVGFNEYSLVATEDQWVPSNGQILNQPLTRRFVSEGQYGFSSTGGGSQGGPSIYETCPDAFNLFKAIDAGAPSLWNGRSVIYTDWYAVWSLPPGTPIAYFEWDQLRGLDVHFDGGFDNSREVELEGKKPVDTYSWNLGDGNSSSEPVFTHTYASVGNYPVSLTVTDDDGESHTYRETIRVSGAVLKASLGLSASNLNVGDTLHVIGQIVNEGNLAATNVSAGRSFLLVPEYPESQELQNVNAKRLTLEPLTDTTYANIAPSRNVTVRQSYKITESARAQRNGVLEDVPVIWKPLMTRVTGTDVNGEPAVIKDQCSELNCGSVRITSQPLTVAAISTGINGNLDAVKSGFDKYIGPITPAGVFRFRPNIFRDGSLQAGCFSACVDVEITVTDNAGNPVEGAKIELTRELIRLPESVVTPDQGDGVFCNTESCAKTLTLPLTTSEGTGDAIFWVPGVIKPITAKVKAKVSKDGFNTTEEEIEIAINPNPLAFGLKSYTPNAEELDAVSAVEVLRRTASFQVLGDWCKWILGYLPAKVPGQRPDLFTKAAGKAGDYVCGKLLQDLTMEDGGIRNPKTDGAFSHLAKAFEIANVYWFFSRFNIESKGSAVLVLDSFSFPWLAVESDFVAAASGSIGKMVKKYYDLDQVAPINLDLFEVSHNNVDEDEVWALYFNWKMGGAYAIDEKKLITKGYDKRIFLRQEPRAGTLTQPAPSGNTSIMIGGGQGLQSAAADTAFDVGHVIVIDSNTASEEKAQIVSKSENVFELSNPLALNHAQGAEVVVKDSLGVRTPEGPIATDGISGLPGAPLEHEVNWYSRYPVNNYKFDLALDSVFTNIVQSFTDITESRLSVSGLEDRKRYYWRVSGINSLGEGDWSEKYSFFTGRPLGDDLAEAHEMSNELETGNFKFQYANTQEANEATSSCGDGENSMWFSYTANTTGTVAVESFKSSFNTILSVWSGSSHPLGEVVCNDDYTGASGNVIQQSYLEFDTVSGSTYYIKVSGASNEDGLVFIRLRNPTQVSNEEEGPSAIFEVIAYPNPAHSSATVEVSLPEPSHLEIEIVDMLGRIRKNLARKEYQRGRHEVRIDVSDLSAGSYLIHVRSMSGVVSKNLSVIK